MTGPSDLEIFAAVAMAAIGAVALVYAIVRPLRASEHDDQGRAH